MKTYKNLLIDKHYTYFVHPIIINESRDQLMTRLVHTTEWNLAVCPTPSKVKEEHYFLPYVRNIIYPTWKWNEEQKQSYLSIADKERIKTLKDFHSVKFIQHSDDRISYQELTAAIFEIELLFLSLDTAFIIFKTEIEGDVNLVQLLKYNSNVRSIETIPQQSEGRSEVMITHRQQMQLYGFRDYINQIYKSIGIYGKVQEIYDQFMFVYNYTAVEFNSFPEHEKQLLLLRCLQAVDEIDEYDEPLELPQTQYYQESLRWIYGFSKTSGILLHFLKDKDKYNHKDKTLQNYFQKVYMKIFLFVFFQRITLLNYTYKLANTSHLLSNRRVINRLRRKILTFTNTYKFSQISNLQTGIMIWKKWSEILEVDTIYTQVQSELTEFDEYVSKITHDKHDLLINIISMFFLPITVISGIMGMNIFEFKEVTFFSKMMLIVSSITIGVTLILYGIFRWISRRSDL